MGEIVVFLLSMTTGLATKLALSSSFATAIRIQPLVELEWKLSRKTLLAHP